MEPLPGYSGWWRDMVACFVERFPYDMVGAPAFEAWSWYEVVTPTTYFNAPDHGDRRLWGITYYNARSIYLDDSRKDKLGTVAHEIIHAISRADHAHPAFKVESFGGCCPNAECDEAVAYEVP